MTTMLVLFGCAAALELGVHLFGSFRRFRSLLAVCSLLVTMFAAGGLLAVRLDVFSVLLAVTSIYRALNMTRIVEHRMHEQYLRAATLRTTLALLLLQGLVVATWAAWERWHTTGHATWATVTGLEVAGGVVLLLSAVRTLRRTMWPDKHANYADAELPTLTVAIPARNETEDLQQCLQSIVASDYPKLEVLVLDDCSQTKRTPEIIRDFAQDGVRFVQGEEPSATWLPKNQAYDRLAHEASGQYILFCGVDVRFEPHTLRAMVATLMDRQKRMLVVLPRRERQAYGRLSLIQAMRYWWELVPPRRMFHRPPVLSTCWLIDAQALAKAGGFAAVARSIVPEAHFAREMMKGDGYSFLRSGDNLGLTSNKTISEQRATAVRMRYPQLHRRPENVAVFALTEVVFLLLPLGIILASGQISVGPLARILAGVAVLLNIVTYWLAAMSTRVNTWWFAVLAQPFAVLTDLATLHYSLWKYEFSEVDWKGRNVCVPVMHVIPSLPAPEATAPQNQHRHR